MMPVIREQVIYNCSFFSLSLSLHETLPFLYIHDDDDV